MPVSSDVELLPHCEWALHCYATSLPHTVSTC